MWDEKHGIWSYSRIRNVVVYILLDLMKVLWSEDIVLYFYSHQPSHLLTYNHPLPFLLPHSLPFSLTLISPSGYIYKISKPLHDQTWIYPFNTSDNSLPVSLFFLFSIDRKHAGQAGFAICPIFVGHGIGKLFHCKPDIWHYGKVCLVLQVQLNLLTNLCHQLNQTGLNVEVG